jgi:cephalosporin hydroxylase
MPVYRATFGRALHQLFLLDLMERTHNFDDVRWLGQPVWQNVLDLWTIQEVITRLRPGLIIETGTNRGGTALFYAHLCELLGHGRVVTIDVTRMHDLEHPRATFVIGSSIEADVIAFVRARADESAGSVFVVLDADHRADHVQAELEAYAPLVTAGSYILVQDGVIDTLPTARAERPGPLVAIRRFLPRHPEFAVDDALSHRFLISSHPMGWLRRRG